VLWGLLNLCYTVAVFTDPGSPLTTTGYAALPTQEPSEASSVTVKSTGEMRFCKKCRTKKPDRTHHCSTCRRCVLKMDHHCPWLATCVGLRNYKPFVLFLIYTTLFCWLCFAVSSTWVLGNILTVAAQSSYHSINYVLLAVLAGIIGLVLTGFTGWHIYLTCTGQTTIESLEKTRYLSPLRKTLNTFRTNHNRNPILPTSDPSSIPAGRPSIGDQLREIHANALPGILRPEEGSSPSPSPTPYVQQARNADSLATTSLRNNYAAMESRRAQERYTAYLDEEDSSKLPHAFDLGLKANLRHVFGPTFWLWPLPICNTTGDGWHWDASPKWAHKREEVAAQRAEETRRQRQREREAGWGVESPVPSPTFGPGYNHQYPSSAFQSNAYHSYGSSGGGGKYPAAVLDGSKAQGRNAGVVDDDDDEYDDDFDAEDSRYLTTSAGISSVPHTGRRSPSKADMILGRPPGSYTDAGPGVPLQNMKPVRPPKRDDEDEGWEEGVRKKRNESNGNATKKPPTPSGVSGRNGASNWNDLPEEMLLGRGQSSRREKKTRDRERAEGEWDDWGVE
jgi:palmitoyltransferase ZDHHC2/15/20